MSANIRLGTSGYSFSDWKGAVYPANLPNSQMFPYYIDHFRLNTVEINYTYYRMPSVKTFVYYANNSPAGFDFTVKLFSGITHDPWKGSEPPSKIAESGEQRAESPDSTFSSSVASRQAHALIPKVDKALCAGFLEAIKPLTESGKLGALLAQFPPGMRVSKGSKDYLLSLRDSMDGLPMVCEFRHKEWASEDTIAMLKASGIGFCAADCPPVGNLMPLIPAVTSDVGYLRLHGRNKGWYTDPAHRYDYLYSEEELRGFIPIINSMASESRVMYVQFNNCHAGSALRNVKMMQFLLGIDPLPAQGVLF